MKKVGFIGAGNMASALVKGLLAAGRYAPGDLVVSDAAPEARRRVQRVFRVEALADNAEVVRRARVVVLAVKPQVMGDVLATIRPAVGPNRLVVSIAAGIPLARLEAGLGAGARVVRVMPNTPALLGKGMSVAVAGTHATDRDLRATVRLFEAVGEAVAVDREELMDAVTALSGSGPAFVYAFAEHLIAGGVAIGLDASLATRLAFATLDGASAMLRAGDRSPRELREMVSSPGGTTLAGLAALAEHDFAGAITAALTAAAARSRELARA
jgi:pyrroline-5-carboxylate reductase